MYNTKTQDVWILKEYIKQNKYHKSMKFNYGPIRQKLLKLMKFQGIQGSKAQKKPPQRKEPSEADMAKSALHLGTKALGASLTKKPYPKKNFLGDNSADLEQENEELKSEILEYQQKVKKYKSKIKKLEKIVKGKGV
jgi:flagellar basal body rod protein FlgB